MLRAQTLVPCSLHHCRSITLGLQCGLAPIIWLASFSERLAVYVFPYLFLDFFEMEQVVIFPWTLSGQHCEQLVAFNVTVCLLCFVEEPIEQLFGPVRPYGVVEIFCEF